MNTNGLDKWRKELHEELHKIMTLIERYASDEQFAKAQDKEEVIFDLLCKADSEYRDSWSIEYDLEDAEDMINELCEEFSWIA